MGQLFFWDSRLMAVTQNIDVLILGCLHRGGGVGVVLLWCFILELSDRTYHSALSGRRKENKLL